MTRPALTGLFPRDDRLVTSTRKHDQGLMGAAELAAEQSRAATELAKAQAEAGVRHATDGQFRWQDLLRPVVEATPGLAVGGLARFHETNTFYRRPLVEGAIDPDGFDIGHFTQHLEPEAVGGAAYRVCLPSPHYVASCCVPAPEPDQATAIAGAVGAAARAAVGQGAVSILLVDPGLGRAGKDAVTDAGRLAALALAEVKAETGYYVYGSDAAAIWPGLLEFPVDRVGVDLVHTDLSSLTSTSKDVVLGVVDGQSTSVEPVDALTAVLEAARERFPESDIEATHAYDLEHVPYGTGLAKLAAIGQACAVVKEVAA